MLNNLTIFLDHWVVEAWGIKAKLLIDPNLLLKTTLKLAKGLKLTVVNSYIHQFQPHGLSLILIIAESHLAIHTWPEYNYMHIDVVSCSRKADLSKLEKSLRQHLKPERLSCQKIKYN